MGKNVYFRKWTRAKSDDIEVEIGKFPNFFFTVFVVSIVVCILKEIQYLLHFFLVYVH